MKKILYITLLLPVLITSAYGMGWRGVNVHRGATAYPAPQTEVVSQPIVQPVVAQPFYEDEESEEIMTPVQAPQWEKSNIYEPVQEAEKY